MKVPRITSLKTSQIGFTIIELMIATAVFTVVLVLSTFALLQVGKIYSKGINTSTTQDVARSIVDEVAQAIQFSGGTVTTPNQIGGTGPYFFNVGDKCYTFIPGVQLTDTAPGVNQSANVFTRNNNGNSCNAPIDWATDTFTELLGQHMWVPVFYVCAPGDATCQSPTPAGSGLYSVGIRVVYGDQDLLCSPAAGDCDSLTTAPASEMIAPDLSCKPQSGTQFCAVSQITTTVQKRI